MHIYTISFYFSIFLNNNKKIKFSYGAKRFGSRGKSDALRILLSFKNNMTTLSKPIPPPACGGAPTANESK